LINNGGHPASALHSDIHGATMVRKRVIDGPQNLNHNVVPKRAEIGRITAHNTLQSASPRQFKTGEHRILLDTERFMAQSNRALVLGTGENSSPQY
jgi:hypothetical protein